jgi:hypothetical protein
MDKEGEMTQEQQSSSSSSDNAKEAEDHLVARNAYWAVSYDPEVECAVLDWLDYNPTAEFKAASERLLAVVIEKGATRVLNNTEHLRMIGKDEQCWVAEDFMPRLQQHGVRVLAMVNSLHYFARLGASLIMSSMGDHSLLIEYFTTKESARQWLKTLAPHVSTPPPSDQK